jgi:hypothetical protein
MVLFMPQSNRGFNPVPTLDYRSFSELVKLVFRFEGAISFAVPHNDDRVGDSVDDTGMSLYESKIAGRFAWIEPSLLRLAKKHQ